MESKTDIHQDAIVRILRAREFLYAGLADLLKRYGLTEPQYNVLRILRGAGPDGLPCLEIGRRLITRVPDVTRLLDRLEKEGLVSRVRNKEDRRVVKTTITSKGLKLLRKIDKPFAELHKSLFSNLSVNEISDLTRIIDKIMKR